MPEFRFIARSGSGELLRGVVNSPDRPGAIVQVERQGAIPIKIEMAEVEQKQTKMSERGRATPASDREAIGDSKSHVAGSDLTLNHTRRHLFTEQLAYLLGAGMTLDEALGVLMKRLKQPQLHELSSRLHRALIDGRSFSQALRDFPRIFSPLYVNLVSAGEASGALPMILQRLVGHLADIKALRDQVQQALLYPAVLIVAGLGLIITFMSVMVPKLTAFFKGSGQPLPGATRLLVRGNELLVHYWWLAVLIVVAAFSVWKAFTARPEGRQAWDAFTWRIPIYSRLIRYQFYAQFAQTLGTLLENGVTLLRSLELLEEISGNAFVRERMMKVRHAVVDGAPLSKALAEEQLFPELFLDMLAVGEQTGKLGNSMQMVAQVYERELNKQIQVVSTLIPPLVMIVIAAVVGLVVYGIMSAVFGLTQNLRVQMH